MSRPTSSFRLMPAQELVLVSMIHLKIIVVEILQNFDIEVVKGHKVEPFPDLYLHMKHGLKVTFKKRCST